MRSSVRTARGILAALLGTVVAIVAAGSASAAVPGDTCAVGTVNLAPSCFEAADGNVANNSALLFDWHTLRDTDPSNPTQAVVVNDGTGTTDFIFKGGSKEQKPTTWGLVQQSSPDKDDLLAAASYVDTVETLGGAHVFFYGAFQRNTNTGNANLSFELNQVRETFDNDNNPSTPPVPVRTEGDVLITYDGNSSNGIRLGACLWHGSERGEADDPAYGWYPISAYNGGAPNPADKIGPNSLCTQITAATTPAAIAAMNSATITGVNQDLSAFSPTILHDNFGELAVDLTQVFANAGLDHGCLSFGALFLHSRSSDTPTSAMKDYVEPQPLRPAGDCQFTMDKRVGVNDQTPRHTTSSDPVFAHVGDTLHYDIAVQNTGDVPLALTFDDPACDAGTITGPDKTVGDADGSFEADEVWTWHCSHVLTDGDVGGPFWDVSTGQFVNTASVHGTAKGFDETHQDSGYAELYGRIVIDKQLAGDFGDADHQFTFDRWFGPTPGDGEPALESDPFTLSANDEPLQIGDVVANSTRPGIQYAVGEQGDGDYSLSALACDDAQTSPSQTSMGDRRADVVVSPGETVTCTFTNRRNTGTIDVVKDLRPADDSGRFDLQVDGVTQKADAGDGDSTGPVSLPTGDHAVGETQGSEGDLGDYQKSIECRADGGQGAVVAATGPDDAGPVTVPVTKDDQIVCTVTNERETGTIEVVKNLRPADDSGRFDLQVDGQTALQDAGDGDSTGPVTLATGDHTVGEAQGSQGQLDDYTKTIECRAGGGDGDVVASSGSDDAGPLTVPVGFRDAIVCTITNVKDATVRVVKDAYPADGTDFSFTSNLPGHAAFMLDDAVPSDDDQVGDDTGPITVSGADLGRTYSVDEAPAERWSLTAAACTGTEATQTATGVSFDVQPGATIVCTFTNRKSAAVEVDKTEAGGPVTGDHVWTFRLTGLGDGSEFSQQQTVDASTPGGKARWEDLAPGDYRLCEIDIPAGWHSVFDAEGATESANDDGTTDVCTDVTLADGDVATVAVDNRHPAIHVVKTGPAEAYPGDTVTFSYAVTATGNTPLSDVAVTDAAGAFKCSPVTGPVDRQNDDGDNLLEPKGADRTNPEVWTYTCSTTIPADHRIGDANPLVNVATATGKDGGETVSDTSRHETTVLHPAIAIDKTGPAQVQAGDTINYTIDVTNPGDVPFAADRVELTDELCAATLTLAGKNGDASPGSLDPGDRWTYTCTYKTTGTEPPIVNVAVVKGTDRNGRSVTAQDSVRTLQQAAAPIEVSARLRGPSGCPTKATYAYVTGKPIRKVVFYVDGRKVKTVTRADSRHRWKVRIVPRRLSVGRHRVKAVVTFTRAAKARPRVMTLAFSRCPGHHVPKFTG